MNKYRVIPLLSSSYIANSYVLADEKGDGVLIDCGSPDVLKRVPKDIRLKALILTHGHFDHVGGAAACGAAGIRIGCFKEEKDIALCHNEGALFGVPVPPFAIDFTFDEGALKIGDIELEVLHTPGHTRGSVCFIAEDSLFSGDTLFCGGYGRTDLYSGSASDMALSLKRLFSLSGDYAVYAGHGGITTLSAERGR